MNCETGQITNDPELIAYWRNQGARILELPDAAEAEGYTTPPVRSDFDVAPGELLETLGAEVVNSAEWDRTARRRETQAFLRKVAGSRR